MSALPRPLAQVLQTLTEDQDWSGFLPMAEVAQRLDHFFDAGGAIDHTVLELACRVQVPPAQLHRHLQGSPHRDRVRW
ncbi:MAG TPA: hypothetical protein VEI97_20320 [bacterium]|nr:hypothetical protein [bacterium]